MDEVLKKDWIIVDICNTLFDSNTTHDFIAYCVGKGKINRSLWAYKAASKRSSPFFWFLVALQKVTKKDYHKALATSVLKNCTIEEVDQWTKSFYIECLNEKKIKQTIDLISNYKDDDIILVSSTLYPIAKTIAVNLQIKRFIATELESYKDRYTGKIKCEVSGNKLGAIQKRFHTDNISLNTVVSDNFSDRELMAHAEHKIAVCYNPSQEKYWKTLPGVTILRIPVSK